MSDGDVLFLEGSAAIKFPASAHQIYASIRGIGNAKAAIRFSMKAHELDGFLKTTLCNKALENYVPTPSEKETEAELNSLFPGEWWQPFRAKTVQRCIEIGEYTSQTIYVDVTDPNTYIIYITTSPLPETLVPTTP